MSSRMTIAEYRSITQGKKPEKYNNKRVTCDGILFQSIAEKDYYLHLKQLKAMKVVSYFLMQVPFLLPGGVKYRLDFLVFYTDGKVDHVDVKGSVTKEFKIKKRQVEDLYPVKINCVKKKGNYFVEMTV